MTGQSESFFLRRSKTDRVRIGGQRQDRGNLDGLDAKLYAMLFVCLVDWRIQRPEVEKGEQDRRTNDKVVGL